MYSIPKLEQLEARDCPAVAVVINGTLIALGTPGADAISVYASGPNQTAVDLNGDGFQDVAVPTNTLPNGVVILGLGGDDILASQPGQTLPCAILGGDGNDNISSFTPGLLDGGAGNDQIYNIVTPCVIQGGTGSDRVVASVQAGILADPNELDQTTVIFGQAQTSPVQLINRVVYFQGTAGADSARVFQLGSQYLVSYNGQSFTFQTSQVDVFASVLGAGDDSFVLAPNVQARGVAYGSSGNDFLMGGQGDALLKGGAGNDVVVGGYGARNDLTGSNGELNPDVDVVYDFGVNSVLRVDATDLVFALAYQTDRIFGRPR